MKQFDVAIIGAGPAGIACALSLIPSGLKVLMIDKAVFPRDKICGDALSADVTNQLKKFYPDVYDDFLTLAEKVSSYGIKIFAPDGSGLDINYSNSEHEAPGYICKRLTFDNFLFQKLMGLKTDGFSVRQGMTIQKIIENDTGIEIHGDTESFHANMLVGADGSKSIVKKTFQNSNIDKNHYSAGIRAYMKNVEDLSMRNDIELHFLPEVLPGYFWIFPLPDQTANVGLGILSKKISDKKLNLNRMFYDIIYSHPVLSKRFKNAELIDDIKGYGLPLGSKKRPLSGDRYLLTGDAAGLIDPFTGEGIGNALRSGRYAAEHLIRCFETNTFHAQFNRAYDRYVYKKMWRELKISRGMQKLLNHPFLFNYVVKKAQNNSSLKKLLTSMLDNIDIKEELISPAFYMKLMFK